MLATVLVPLTDRLERAGVPRGLGAVLVLLLGMVVAAAILAMIVSGIVAQSDEIWLQLERGLRELNERLSGGGQTRHAVVPVERARRIVDRLVTAFRGYAWGLTVLGVANAAIVALGAWLLGVPLVGPIAVVSFVTSYVPDLGAFVAGAFAVLIAYGSGGLGDALAMLVVVLLANGVIQNLLEAFALGARLRLHPLAVLLIVTSAAALAGALGAVLAAPLVSAAVNGPGAAARRSRPTPSAETRRKDAHRLPRVASNDHADDRSGRPGPRVRALWTGGW